MGSTEDCRQPPAELLEAGPGACIVRVVRLVDVQQVDVLTVVELAATQPAEPDDDERSGRSGALALRQVVAGDPQGAGDDDSGQVGELLGGRSQRVLVEQIAAGDAQDLAPLEALEGVELARRRLVLRQQRIDLGPVVHLIRRGAAQLALQPVEVLRIADQDLAEEL